MTALAVFALLAGLAGGLLWFAGRHYPLAATLLVVALAANGWVAIIELPGHPKPARIELLEQVDGAEILWHGGSESEGLHVLLAGPKLYSLPWSERTARALHEASRQAENEGGSFVLREPQDGTPGGEWSAEHRPAEPGPPKE